MKDQNQTSEDTSSVLEEIATQYAVSRLNQFKQKDLLISSGNYELIKQLLVLGYMEGFIAGYNFNNNGKET